MKTDIHPTYYAGAVVTCVCGNTFTTGSTKKNISVEVCYKCHPLYTGEHRFLDVKGRVDTFKKKQAAAATYKATYAGKKNKKSGAEEKKVKSLKELLSES
ncbi:50S ribosomal protein L31 [Candidatus Roizmanbacteria bacterium RIFCSPLOWO2_01_FULL_44_13]|uniref:50S ribosomal protein L31 n=1 Tax=Candidatus Roizmanbacteria bacterium RIFCSPLOWO2_01_FULL_44_13 TaxID=1802069 RepID=A0A1F7JB84_9BACT|nr:MAG: 50S ribosomal protein L31 [Candidatus Roizmanbacteria bacterium RIFCSPLOWO2_01_FULL_44_13]